MSALSIRWNLGSQTKAVARIAKVSPPHKWVQTQFRPLLTFGEESPRPESTPGHHKHHPTAAPLGQVGFLSTSLRSNRKAYKKKSVYFYVTRCDECVRQHRNPTGINLETFSGDHRGAGAETSTQRPGETRSRKQATLVRRVDHCPRLKFPQTLKYGDLLEKMIHCNQILTQNVLFEYYCIWDDMAILNECDVTEREHLELHHGLGGEGQFFIYTFKRRRHEE